MSPRLNPRLNRGTRSSASVETDGDGGAEPDAILQARRVTKKFGGLIAVNQVSLDVRAGEILGLIGPNGAGKTTFFNCLTGMEVPTSGEIVFESRPLHGRPERITKRGVARTFQNIRLFPIMTVEENVIVGRHCRTTVGVLEAIARGPRFRREERESKERAAELLRFVGLTHSSDNLARNLPYGDQRRLEIARALATEPHLLLLDEPTAGMNPQETRAGTDLIRRVRDQKITVVVIEHDMRFIFGICDRVAALVEGRLLTVGSPLEVQTNPRLIEAYLGKSAS
jgi:branched-chain amino acid transport system ATP-binding protein